MRRLILTTLLTLVSTGAWGDVVSLECLTGDHGRIFVLDESNGTVQLVTPNFVRQGKYQVDEHRYQLQFPRTETGWEIHVTIMRYSGKMTWEHGDSPFDEDSLDNVFSTGQCKRINYEPTL